MLLVNSSTVMGPNVAIHLSHLARVQLTWLLHYVITVWCRGSVYCIHDICPLMFCRQGKQFVGLAQSIGPHLGYLLAPSLDVLQPQIKLVAAANHQMQQSRRRSVSCTLPPLETLTVHDSADSISNMPQASAVPQPTRQGHPPSGHPPQHRAGSVVAPPQQPQQSASRMLSPFQTWSAPPAPQAASIEGAASQERGGSPQRPGSDRLDLSPAKTALDMSMLEVARLTAASPNSGRPPLQPEAVLRHGSGDQGSGRKSATAADITAAAVAVMRSSRDLELEGQPSIEASPRGSGGLQEFGRSRGKAYRRAPMPMLRASSPLSAYGSEPSGNLPRQLSIPGSSFAGYPAQAEPQQAQEDAAQPYAAPASPFATAVPPISLQSPFAGGLPLSSSPPSSAWYSSPSMQTSGSTIAISSLLPPLSAFSQAPGSSQRQSRMSPYAAASLAASLPPEISTSAMAVLSSPMAPMQPGFHPQSMAALTMPAILPMSGPGLSSRSPTQQSRSMLPPALFAEPQPRADQHSSHRLPPQLQSTSLLLQLLPAGSAQSLNRLMSRAASHASVEYTPQEPMSIARSCSLTNDESTSVSMSSPKQSLLDMSRAVSEQLHLTAAGKGVQRPFVADLQQRWSAGHQVSLLCILHSVAHVPVLQSSFTY